MFNRKEEKEFYINHLNQVILPFWLDHSIDEVYGGYYTCFNNKGDQLISENKYIWSQGRMVWVLSKLSTMEIYSKSERKRFLTLATTGAEFLQKNVLCENGNCAFFTDRKGNKLSSHENERCDSSFYADCFVILGLSMYYCASKDNAALEFAYSLYQRVFKRVKTNDLVTEPYPVPVAYKAHGVPMIMLNTSQEMYQALKCARMDDRANKTNENADGFMNIILDEFVTKQNLIHEFITEDKNANVTNLILEYINPGHSIEDAWFLLHQAKQHTNKKTIEKIVAIIKANVTIGWDKLHGGIFAFSSVDGGKPKGSIKDILAEKMTSKIINDWDCKLWWVHSEALYALLLAYDETEDAEILALYSKVKTYTFKTFPNKDKKIGEWVQIRDRLGHELDKKVALPVKDPFHIMRNLIYMIEKL